MAYATDTFIGDGSTVEFTLTFKFIQRDHVEVYRVVTATKAKTKLTVIASGAPTGDQFIWVNDENIKVGTAPTVDQQIEVIRDTPEDQQIIDWKDGSYIVANDLNTSDKQWLYGLQELEDKVDAIDGSTSGEAVKGVTGTAPITVDNTDPQKPIIGSDAVTTVTGTSPISVDLTDPQKPAVSVDAITKAQAESDPTNPSWDTDDKLASAGAIDRVFKQVVGNGAGFPGPGNKAKDGQLRVDNTGLEPDLYYWDASLGNPAWVQISKEGPQGPQGPIGPAGPPPGLQNPAASASNVALNNDGSLGTATATVTQDANKDLKFEFGIPVGQKGDKGDTGSGVTYKGLIDATTAAEPVDPQNGDFYVNTGTGNSAWAGAVVEGTRIVWNDATSNWDTFAPVASQTLQAVCDVGNFTTTNVAVGGTNASPKIELKNDGTAIFDDLVESKNNGFKFPDGTTQTTAAITSASTLQEVTDAGNFTDNDIDIGGTSGSPNIQLEATGAATFEGRLEADQGSFNGDVGIIGESGNQEAFFIRDAGVQGNPTTFSVTADGTVDAGALDLSNVDAKGCEITAAGTLTQQIDKDEADATDVYVLQHGSNKRIEIQADGEATHRARLNVSTSGSVNNASDYVSIYPYGQVGVRKNSGNDSDDLWFGISGTDTTSRIKKDGSAEFHTELVLNSAYQQIYGNGGTSNAFQIYKSEADTTRVFNIQSDGAVDAANYIISDNFIRSRDDASNYCEMNPNGGIQIIQSNFTKFQVDFNGNVEADGTIQAGGNAKSGTAMGVSNDPTGTVSATTNSGTGSLWEGYTTGNNSATSTIKANGNATFGEVTCSATAVPLFVNSTNSNNYKIGLQDSGTIRSYLGASSTKLLQVANSSGGQMFTVDNNGTCETSGILNVGSGSSGNSTIGISSNSTDRIIGVLGQVDRSNATYGINGYAKGGTQSQYGVYGVVDTSSSYSSGGLLGYSINSNTYGIVGYWDTSQYYAFYGNGPVGGTSFPTVSDERLKNFSGKVEGVLDKLDDINTYYYTWKDNTQSGRSADGSTEIGLSAQEVQAQFPEVVGSVKQNKVTANNKTTLEEDLENTLTVDYGRLSSILIQAVKELREENKALQERISALESSN